jgi:hypothetical protein
LPLGQDARLYGSPEGRRYVRHPSPPQILVALPVPKRIYRVLVSAFAFPTRLVLRWDGHAPAGGRR